MRREVELLGRRLAYRALEAVAPDGVRVSIQDHDRGERRDGARDVVLIHGFSQSSLAWLKQVTGPLADAHRLVTYDLRGHGGSDKPRAPERYRDPAAWAGELAAVIEATGLCQPVLIPWSYAGRVAFDYLCERGGGGIGGIVAVAATSHGGPDHLGPATPLLRAMAGAADIAQDVATTRALLAACTSALLPAEEEALMLAFNMAVPAEIRRAMTGRAAAYDEALQSFAGPVLAIHGGCDPINLPGMSRHTAALAPRGRALIYKDAGHMPFWEEADRFDADVAAFLAALDTPQHAPVPVAPGPAGRSGG